MRCTRVSTGARRFAGGRHLRRDLHQHRVGTARSDVDVPGGTPDALGYDVRTGIARTGLVGILRGGGPGGGRASLDMDALRSRSRPAPLRSTVRAEFNGGSGVMHAWARFPHGDVLGAAECGRDEGRFRHIVILFQLRRGRARETAAPR